ncbi:hypothetical protein B0H17DRAFT_1213303 [Mycena rosella]|uniref:Uncharacterized protein n=1 Tax=Mycena rosella TaxID=1033263 RepID=A0AAD7CQJ0_MYCRO|nr:hypothetical protein B0H17DRAFT_1213303 [Mycena rosella]
MRMRFTDKQLDRAVASIGSGSSPSSRPSTTLFPVARPRHPLTKVKPSQPKPLVYCANGKTLSQHLIRSPGGLTLSPSGLASTSTHSVAPQVMPAPQSQPSLTRTKRKFARARDAWLRAFSQHSVVEFEPVLGQCRDEAYIIRLVSRTNAPSPAKPISGQRSRAPLTDMGRALSTKLHAAKMSLHTADTYISGLQSKSWSSVLVVPEALNLSKCVTGQGSQSAYINSSSTAYMVETPLDPGRGSHFCRGCGDAREYLPFLWELLGNAIK